MFTASVKATQFNEHYILVNRNIVGYRHDESKDRFVFTHVCGVGRLDEGHHMPPPEGFDYCLESQMDFGEAMEVLRTVKHPSNGPTPVDSSPSYSHYDSLNRGMVESWREHYLPYGPKVWEAVCCVGYTYQRGARRFLIP